MAEDQGAEQEPSIEEILASIRQIISDDDEEEGGAEPSPPETPVAEKPEEEAAADQGDDIVELTDKLDDEPVAVEDSWDESEPEPEIKSEPEPEPEPEIKPEPVEVDMRDFEPEPEVDSDEDDLDSLLTQEAENAAYEGFAELARKTAVESGGITLEEIVRTELKPLLRAWLDRNLPSIIERLVREELERVAKRAVDE